VAEAFVESSKHEEVRCLLRAAVLSALLAAEAATAATVQLATVGAAALGAVACRYCDPADRTCSTPGRRDRRRGHHQPGCVATRNLTFFGSLFGSKKYDAPSFPYSAPINAIPTFVSS
jgi:hypothetical protein